MLYQLSSTIPENFDTLSKFYTYDEKKLRDQLISICRLTLSDRESIKVNAQEYVDHLRSNKNNAELIDTFLLEYGLSTTEGLTLMRLAEALIRTPDFGTGRLLMRDKLQNGSWSEHARKSDSFWVNQATSGLRVTKQWIKKSGGVEAQNLAARLGDRAMGLGVAGAMSLMGDHFVLGRNIVEATKKARHSHDKGFTHSYDMLGEAAYTEDDAECYFQAYLSAIQHLAKTEASRPSIADTSGISVKLSALHPRYEYSKRKDCVPVLINRLVELAKVAKEQNLGLTIDAEETDRLEISLIVFEALLRHDELSGWDGLGIVIQAYQRRATKVISSIIENARLHGRKITVRLVKGAYWDMEIKRAQELGLPSYPVFTRKENTDISYIACSRLLLDAADTIYPQFATHNALTVATILHMSGENENFEFQRLHGMGEALHKALISQLKVKCRIYAPVGNHKDLLPYLVRRLLENGANSSFVNQLFNETVPVDKIIEDPFVLASNFSPAVNERIPAPTDLFEGERASAAGIDTTQSIVECRLESLADNYEPCVATSIVNGQRSQSELIKVYNPAVNEQCIGYYSPAVETDSEQAIKAAKLSNWGTKFSVDERAICLERTADLLEERMHDFLKLCTLEAGKTYLDGVAEVREAVDFCRYYAVQARKERIVERKPIGTVACISPWNFPLAIFIGQIVASLSVGNTVIAKPAEQTPLISYKAVNLLFEAGVPHDAVHLIIGDGALLGNHLSAHSGIDAVCFTGSTETAKRIAQNLKNTNRSTVPFIAETGGINAMIVDSTALLEQAVQDLVASAFQSAGQRCSACRLVCVQDEIADDFIEMLTGAMKVLQLGNPSELATDVGPVIDAKAKNTITSYIDKMKTRYKALAVTPVIEGVSNGHFVKPIAFEIDSVADLKKEIFGPVLHVLRFEASDFKSIIGDINKLGYGLTLGLHSRLDDRVAWVSENAKVGNLYVNRNQIGAVVGVQPFGGEGQSGTGPKAGGPHYLLQLSKKPTFRQGASETDNSLETNFKECNCDEVTSREVLEILEQSKKSSLAWSTNLILVERRNFLDATFRKLINSNDDFWRQFICDAEVFLPGPTGESNILRLHTRGVIVCIGKEDAMLKQVALALYAGNSVVAIPLSGGDKLEELMKILLCEFNLPNLIQIVNLSKLSAFLGGPIDGVAADGEWRDYVGNYLCRREGAILPILSANSDPERFFHERVVTINTTAAGGNATLLTLG